MSENMIHIGMAIEIEFDSLDSLKEVFGPPDDEFDEDSPFWEARDGLYPHQDYDTKKWFVIQDLVPECEEYNFCGSIGFFSYDLQDFELEVDEFCEEHEGLILPVMDACPFVFLQKWYNGVDKPSIISGM